MRHNDGVREQLRKHGHGRPFRDAGFGRLTDGEARDEYCGPKSGGPHPLEDTQRGRGGSKENQE